MYKVQSKIFISTVCKNSETLIAFHVFYIHEKKVKVCCFVREFIFMAVNRRSRGETPFPGVAAPVQVNFKTPTIFSWLSDNSPREHSPISDLIFLPNTQSPFFSPPFTCSAVFYAFTSLLKIRVNALPFPPLRRLTELLYSIRSHHIIILFYA